MSSIEENRQAAADFFEQIWNQKDESAIDRFIALDAAGNDPKFGVGRESFREQWKKWHAAFPDLHFDVREIIAEGDRVVTPAPTISAKQQLAPRLQLMGCR